jgi:hypothetical protein
MLVLAVVLSLVVGGLSSRLPDADQRPRGRALVTTVLRGYPNAVALFVVIMWMMLVAPIGQLRAIAKWWDSVHVPMAVKPGGYERVVADLAGALESGGIEVRRRRAPGPTRCRAKSSRCSAAKACGPSCRSSSGSLSTVNSR